MCTICLRQSFQWVFVRCCVCSESAIERWEHDETLFVPYFSSESFYLQNHSKWSIRPLDSRVCLYYLLPLHSPSSKCFFTTFPVPFHHFRYSHFAFYICIHRPFPLYTLLAGFSCVCVAVVVARFPIKKHIRHASTCYCSFALLLSYIENRFVVSECLWINCFTLISRPNIQWPWLKCIHSMAWLQIRHRTNDTPEKFHEMPFSMDCILYE